jgi:hypothetical protein
MVHKVLKFVREYISVWDEVEVSTTKLILHFADIDCKLVLACQLIALRKMVDFLVFI